MNNPKVTVLMPVYNGEKYLAEAIESILNQTYKDFEFLIINDGSTDNSVKIIESYNDPRINLVHNKRNLKLIATLNKGLNIAKGEYIARMDCDDVSLPDRLLKQVEYLDNHPDVGVLGCGTKNVDEKLNTISEPERPLTYLQNKWRLLFKTTLMHPSVMYRKNLILKYGGYSNRFIHAEDYDLWSRLIDSVIIHQIPETLVYLRKHNQNIGIVYKDISSINIPKISINNIIKLNSKNLNQNNVSQVVKLYCGERKNFDHNFNICKTLLLIYFRFEELHSLSVVDRHWINKNFINIMTPSLFKLNIFSQVSIIWRSIRLSFYTGKIDFNLYLLFLKKYFKALLIKFHKSFIS